MLGRLPIQIGEERGSTMVELLVGMAMGMIVLVGLTMTLIVVLHGTARVDARVEATDNARLAVTRIMEELHSACVAPQIAPVRANSTGNTLIFWHAAGEQGNKVNPAPVKTKIAYASATETLTQTDFGLIKGEDPSEWEFEDETIPPEPGESRTLLTDVTPAAGRQELFTYEKYAGGGPAEVPAISGLSEAAARSVILVNVSLTAGPRSTPVADAGADATIQDSATLRLTPPSYISGTEAAPCE